MARRCVVARPPHVAPKHGVLGVADHVQQHLLELLRVAADAGGGRVELQLHLNAGVAQRVGAKAHRLFDDRVDINRAGAVLGRSGEQQQILDHGLGAIAFLFDQLDRFALVIAELFFEQDLRKGGDAGKRVIDLVGHASHQLTQGDHLFRVPKLLFEPSVLAHVAYADDLAEQFAVVSGEGTDCDGGGELAAIASPMYVMREAYPRFEHAIRLAHASAGILPDHELFELHLHELDLRPPVLACGGRIGVAHTHVIENEDRVVDRGERGGEQMFAFAGEALFFVEEQCVEGEGERNGQRPFVGERVGHVGRRDIAEAWQLGGPAVGRHVVHAFGAGRPLSLEHIERAAGGHVFDVSITCAGHTNRLADGGHEAVEDPQEVGRSIGERHGLQCDAGQFGGSFGALALEVLEGEQPCGFHRGARMACDHGEEVEILHSERIAHRASRRAAE